VSHLPVRRNLKILIVDDDPLVCTIVGRYLEFDEHEVTMARSGSEALEKMNQTEFDLVITDQVMPKMSGDQLAMAIRQVKPSEPIILLTGYETGGKHESIDALLSKPTTVGTLRDAISFVMTSNPRDRFLPNGLAPEAATPLSISA
jgi:CheY-like chemotaxis protein